ncbi:ankyrin-1-like [Microplitis demolitor]|uniref:ankyrin-1-like n=1 Tax=Microplitis demolitor TaxID=69319 RepID=UPI0004CDBCC4|nr:ankyrin-1-like [Microplitis demolitor]
MVLNRLNFTYEYVYNLIEQGVIEDINTVVPVMGGLKLLYVATFNNDKKLVDYLLRKKAGVHSKSQYWGTPLHTAVIMEYIPITESLINYGADVNAELLLSSSVNHFRKAVIVNNHKIPQFLLKRDDDLSTILSQYQFCSVKRPLKIAIERSKEEMVQLLLKSNADPNLNSYFVGTSLCSAISQKNLTIIKLLLAYGADVNGVIGSGIGLVSPLPYAAECQNSRAVELILNDIMVDVNMLIGIENSALHCAV